MRYTLLTLVQKEGTMMLIRRVFRARKCHENHPIRGRSNLVMYDSGQFDAAVSLTNPRVTATFIDKLDTYYL